MRILDLISAAGLLLAAGSIGASAQTVGAGSYGTPAAGAGYGASGQPGMPPDSSSTSTSGGSGNVTGTEAITGKRPSGPIGSGGYQGSQYGR